MAVIDIIGLIFGIITFIFIAMMLFNFISNEYKFNKYGFKFWKSQYQTILSVLIFSSYLIFSVHTTTHSIYSITASFTNSFSASWCLSYFHEMWSFSIGKMFLYLFFILRLHEIFKDSSFAISVIKLKLIALLVELPLLLSAITFTITAEIAHSSAPHWNNEEINGFPGCDALFEQYETRTMQHLRIFIIALYLISELIYSIIILRLFLSRVMSLSMTFDEIQIIQSEQSNNNPSELSIDSVSNTESPKSVNERMENDLFLNLAIKTSNVVIMAICTNYIMLIKYGLVLPASILNIDVFFNCLAVYLSYAFTSKYYNKVFGCFHKCCYQCCIKLCYCCCTRKEMESQQNHNNIEMET